MTNPSINILRIDSSARRDDSETRALNDAFIRRIGATADTTVIHRDLAADLPSFVNEGWVGANFTDESFHNTGVSPQPLSDLGRGQITGRNRDRGRFKTPTLREVARTAPYMHDGSLATLQDVIDFYDDGGRKNPHRDPELRPLRLTKGEKTELAAFLKSLTGTVKEGL